MPGKFCGGQKSAILLGRPEGRDTFLSESPGVARGGGMVNRKIEGCITSQTKSDREIYYLKSGHRGSDLHRNSAAARDLRDLREII